MEVIVPCAGLSTRFPNMRPKYLLTDYKGNLMIENAIRNYVGKYNITLTILQEHDDKYSVRKKLKDTFGDKVNVHVLEHKTNGPAETVYQTVKTLRHLSDTKILIKDCDGFYDANEEQGNVIYTAKLSKNPNIRTATAKSYIIKNNQGIITTVIEKQIVSDSFCVGGYQFESMKSFMHSYESINKQHEVFVSHIIDHMIIRGEIFVESEVKNFIDVGVLEDWKEYNNRPTYFCDIDGTIVKSKFDYTKYEPIRKNINFLLKELNRDCKIVFVTARSNKHTAITRQMLDDLGFGDCQLIMNAHHSKRILINDFAATNPYPSAIAVNLTRDADNLEDYL